MKKARSNWALGISARSALVCFTVVAALDVAARDAFAAGWTLVFNDERSAVYPLAATSSARMATTSQRRSLLSIAKLNMARSRERPSNWSFVRIDQTCLGRSGGFAPVSFPLFQGTRLSARR